MNQDNITSILYKIRCIVNERQIDLSAWFRDFDHCNHKRVSKTQFRRALSSANVPISTEDFDIICDAFEDQNDVNWQNFVNKVYMHIYIYVNENMIYKVL
eukprot:GHVL01006531.1.p1 GENE.GHVL01006531.1~~GHVL01006531.1.p1  ORF type:complete len:100 (-),score=13.52 GHVL01006531.1:169-468(-)